jgi:hypothetical protein
VSYSIKVSTNAEFRQVEPPPFFVRNFASTEEFQRVTSLCDNKRRIGWLESLVIPVRTNNLNNFCKDFFFPGLFNRALKTHDVATKIFLCIFMPICDIISLPIRLITAIPRYLYNAAHPKETHPLYRYLMDNGVPAATLSADYVYLKFSWIENKGVFGQERERNLTTQGETFNFIQLPTAISNVRHEFCKYGLSDQHQQPMIEKVS